MASKYVIAVVGASSLIGQELLKMLPNISINIAEIRLFDTEPGRKKPAWYNHQELEIEELGPRSFLNTDVVVILERQEALAGLLASALRLASLVVHTCTRLPDDEPAPIVVPEINPEAVTGGLVYCPHPLVSQVLTVIYPLHREVTLQRLTIDALEATSAAGQGAMSELSLQSRQVLRGRPAIPHAHPHQIAFNLLPETSVFMDNGYTREEWTIIDDLRKVIGLPGLPVSTTVVRAPVHVGNAAILYTQFENYISVEDARRILARSPGVRLQDDPSISIYPHPWSVVGTDEVHIGRIREDPGHPNGLAMWMAADNLRKGAATNVIQIIEIARLKRVI